MATTPKKRGGVPGNKGGKGKKPLPAGQKLVRIWASVRPDVAAWLATQPATFVRDTLTTEKERAHLAELRAELAKVSEG
jgi:hypothetical protein